MGIRYTSGLNTGGSRRRINQVFLWCALWMGAGLWIWAGLQWLLRLRFPNAFHSLDLPIGIFTGFAFIYGSHFLVFAECSKSLRRICVPLLALVDILALCGFVALVLDNWQMWQVVTVLAFGGAGIAAWLILRYGRNYGFGTTGGSQTEPPLGSAPPPPPDAGKPVPVHPRPTHHLVAVKSLPPSGKTYLIPKD